MSSPGEGGAILIVVGVTAALVIAVAVLAARLAGSRTRPDREDEPAGATTTPSRRRRAAVVINPTKVADPRRSRGRATRAFDEAGWAPPLWLETTADDPGHGQAAAALSAEVDLVVAQGGDGTVRAVADALTGTATPLGLVPLGTGNLLARTLGLPLVDGAAALDIALHGRTRRIDVGRAVVHLADAQTDGARPDGGRPDNAQPDDRGGGGFGAGHDASGEGSSGEVDDEPVEESFLVMAGLGFDAEVMAGTQPRLKQRVGWWAYVVSGASRLRGQRTRVEIVLDGETRLVRRVRGVTVGNCGELTGGVRLLPDALVDDGWLDVVVVSPRTVPGWALVALRVLARSRRQGTAVERFRCKEISIRADRPIMAQLDGDPVGLAVGLDAHVAHLALHVQVKDDGAAPPAG